MRPFKTELICTFLSRGKVYGHSRNKYKVELKANRECVYLGPFLLNWVCVGGAQS